MIDVCRVPGVDVSSMMHNGYPLLPQQLSLRFPTWASQIRQLKMDPLAVIPFAKFVSSPYTSPHRHRRLSGKVYFLPHIIRHKLQCEPLTQAFRAAAQEPNKQ